MTKSDGGPDPINTARAHPWKNSALNVLKLKAARLEAKRRSSLKYRHENIEDRRAMERHWHRKKHGIDVEAPVMTKAEASAKGRESKAIKRLNEERNKPTT